MANVNIKTLDPAVFLNSVGIGDTDPAYKLSVKGSVNIHSSSTGSDPADGSLLYFSDATTFNVRNLETGDIVFKTNPAADEMVRIKSSGKVGIGTASPDHFLEIVGGSSTDVLHLNSTAPILKVTATNNASGLRINAVGLTSGHLFRVQKDGTTKFEIDYNGNLILQNSSGTELLFNGSSNNANITSEGNLYLLAKTGKKLYLGSNNVNGQIVLDDGQTYFYGQLNIPGGSGSTTNRLNFNYNSSNGVAEIAPDSSGGNTELKFSTCIAGTKSERMRIDSAGRIKIANLPDSDPGVAGALYREGSDVKISI